MKLTALFLITIALMTCTPPQPTFDSLEEYPVYAFDDLGVTYTPEATTFKLWSPTAQSVRLRRFDTDAPAVEPVYTDNMEDVDGAWTATIKGDLDGTYYTFQVKRNGRWQEEATDPYARATGTNGMRAQVVNLTATDPEGWENDTPPDFAAATDAVIYELHVRDLSISANSGIENKGKFLGLTEGGTTTPNGIVTGLDHLKEMGITHLHLLPSFDYLSVDEARPEDPQFNWGYDPQNYNVPEGSYATDASNGRVRIREFKKMVKALHEAGIRVVMDVVYNHTGRTENSLFQHLIPDYFYRFTDGGEFSNASGCGNEIASERPMVRKYIRESVAYWVDEYHVDGFRFDLMGIHDIATMNEIAQRLRVDRPDILIYGEGWTAGSSPLPDSLRALKANTNQLDDIAAFSDDIRDGMKGSVFNHEEKGFVSGAGGRGETIKFGIVGATNHRQLNFDSVNYSSHAWANEPGQCINYASCHDNHTLWDRLRISNTDLGPRVRARMQRMALGIVLTSQGIPFLHAGTEFCRSKDGEENSYKSPDEVNAIRWDEKKKHAQTVDYVKNLIALRKAHPAFRLGSTEAINQHLTFEETNDDLLVSYRIEAAPNDEWKDVFVVLNGHTNQQNIELPEGEWTRVVNGGEVNVEGIGRPVDGRVRMQGSSVNVFVRKE